MTLKSKNTDHALPLIESLDLFESYNSNFKQESDDHIHKELIYNNKLFITLEFDIRGDVPEVALVFPKKIISDWKEKNFT